MPIYEFHCQSCNQPFSVRRSFSQGTDDVTCPTCQAENVERIFTPVMAFSKGQGGKVSAVSGAGGCASCAATTCAGCASLRRR